MTIKVKILILGISGMLGHAVFKHFYGRSNYSTYGTVRSNNTLKPFFNVDEQQYIISGVDAENFDSFLTVFEVVQPDVVINCIGIIKHLPESKDYFKSININSFLPHRLAKLCSIASARLIHISTDCVFDGKTGNYKESDNANADDLYGKSKFLGEVDYQHAITIRTSIIGHELNSNISLIDWFLCQQKSVNGYTNAIYSGFPTYEIANIIEGYIIPNKSLHGLYHVSSDPINKYDLLKLVASIYHKKIQIVPYSGFVLNRALDSSKFREITQFKPKVWLDLIEEMHSIYSNYTCYKNKYTLIGK